MTLNGFEESVGRAGALLAGPQQQLPWVEWHNLEFRKKRGIFFHNYVAGFNSSPAHCLSESRRKNNIIQITNIFCLSDFNLQNCIWFSSVPNRAFQDYSQIGKASGFDPVYCWFEPSQSYRLARFLFYSVYFKEQELSMKVETVSINKIKPYENNPRNNDDAVDAVANSIKEFGWQQPIVVDNGGGNHSWSYTVQGC